MKATVTAICALLALACNIGAHAEPTPSPSRSASAQSEENETGMPSELTSSAAQNATFSRDGSHVYAVDIETSHLLDIDLQKGTVTTIDLGASIEHKSIISVGTNKSGELVFCTARVAWKCNPMSKDCTKICSAPEGATFAAMGCDPKSGGILFATRTDFDWPAQNNEKVEAAMFLAPGTTEPKPVWSRRVGFLDGITFSTDGDLFFGYRGDLWMGGISPNEDNQETPWLIDAVRCAPLATLETTMATPTQVGVFNVAVAKQTIYVQLHRMFGTGNGNVIRLPKPDGAVFGRLLDQEGDDDIRDRMRLYSKETGAVESLTPNGTISYLCATPDGRRVFFTSGVLGKEDSETKAYLIENNGKPRELKLKFGQ